MGKPKLHLNAGSVGINVGPLPLLAIGGVVTVIGGFISIVQAAAHDWRTAAAQIPMLVALAGLAAFALGRHRRELRRLGRR